MVNKIKGLLNEEAGQGMTEYGLVLGLIAVAVVTTLVALRGQIVNLFNNAKSTVDYGVTNMGTPPPTGN
jgi:pilus assembly protein Flp/PilA